MNKKCFAWTAILVFFLIDVAGAQGLPAGVTMKEHIPIKNAVTTQINKDYYRDGVKFFTDGKTIVPGAPKEVRSYHFHHGGNVILMVDADDQSAHFAGDGDCRIWVWKDSVTIFCLDDDYFVYVRFDEAGDPIFQSNDEQAEMSKTYITNKKHYQQLTTP
jgi:hypothetical protein